MRAWVISDLHVTPRELRSVPFSIPDADICLCAGDVSGHIETTIQFLLARIEPYMPVILTLGNHDYYGNSIESALSVARREINGSNLTILENECTVVGSVRVIGATLWTDFCIPHGGPGPHLPFPVRKDVAIQIAQRYMLDFHEIDGSKSFGLPGLITPDEWIGRHYASRNYINAQLDKTFDGRTVVLTHHAPTPRSMHPDFFGHATTGAFVSDLTDVITRGKPELWVHGHVHKRFDYSENGTRIICNPRGYPNEYGRSGFRAGLVVDL